MNKILFRADAKPSIGTGDLTSLIQLSKTFEKNGWESHFMIRDSEGGRRLIKDYAIKRCHIIPDAFSVDKEVDEINQYLTERRITHFFACITERTLSGYTGLSSKVVKGCVNCDGIVPRDWRLVVNWNFPSPSLYRREDFPDTRFLLGPEFVILPDNFNQEVIARRVYKRPIQNLLIAMGGADEFNLTTDTVKKIIDEDLGLHLTIILGAAFRGHDELHAVLKSSGLAYACKTAVTDMFSEYMGCDVAIGTGGLTSSEFVATHTPALLVSAYDHQTARCRYFHDRGMVIFLGERLEYSTTLLRKSIEKLQSFSKGDFAVSFCGNKNIYDVFSALL